MTDHLHPPARLFGGLSKATAEALDTALGEVPLLSVNELPAGLDIGKHQVFGIGPEINLPIVAKQKLIAMLSARYLFEFGAESTTEGDTFFFGLTFPVGVDLGS